MRDEKRLYDNVSSRTPGGLPRSNVDEDKVHLQKKIIELYARGGERKYV